MSNIKHFLRSISRLLLDIRSSNLSFITGPTGNLLDICFGPALFGKSAGHDDDPRCNTEILAQHSDNIMNIHNSLFVNLKKNKLNINQGRMHFSGRCFVSNHCACVYN